MSAHHVPMLPFVLFVAENELAPPGWCQIQRSDSVDEPGLVRIEDDEHAGRLVAECGGAPGTACLYAPAAHVMFRVEAGGGATREEWALIAALRHDLAALNMGEDADADPDAAPKWIVIVPALVVRRASPKLISPKDLKRAQSGWT